MNHLLLASAGLDPFNLRSSTGPYPFHEVVLFSSNNTKATSVLIEMIAAAKVRTQTHVWQLLVESFLADKRLLIDMEN